MPHPTAPDALPPAALVPLLAALAAPLLGGCAAPLPSYDDAADNVVVADMERTTVTVDPRAAWQDSGVYLPAGATARITAAGKWSPWPTAGLWSGPEGNEAWQGQVSFIPASALMGRLGTDGKPFYIGPESEITARDNGRLYLAMNDPFAALWDNAGEMEATIRVRYPKPGAPRPEAPGPAQ